MNDGAGEERAAGSRAGSADVGVPASFVDAFAGLEQLVGRMVGNKVGDEALVGQVGAWARQDCGGSATLCKAAVLAMRYQLGTKSLQGPDEGVASSVRALERVSRVVEPPERTDGAPAAAVRVKLPEALRRSMPGAQGFLMDRAQILAAAGPDGWHLSFSHPERYPTWRELLRARRDVLGEAAPELWVRVPAPGSEPPGFLVHLFETPPAERKGGGGGDAGREGRRGA